MPKHDFFSKFDKIGESVTPIEYESKMGRRSGVSWKLPWNANYRKRSKNSKKNNLHEKRLKYPKELQKKAEELIKDKPDWIKDLEIESINSMFIVALEKLIESHE